jgi:hypothetical protein
MELGPVVTAFVGGGVVGGAATALFNYLSDDRLDRRATIRPKDIARIDRVRELSYSFIPSGEHQDPWSEGVSHECTRLVTALDDKELKQAWDELDWVSRSFRLKYKEAPDVWQKLSLAHQVLKSHERLTKRLNELERKR